ncbi:FAD-binding oxidoreductase [Protaetiibacter intestinalis]|uniref:FAD-binding oxidoreductase n=1 Tax=Protaetiibacter intestinalis TaxID=2419774 RepID=A0A387B6D7_9MICO|nr:FAD-binding oxidoreductase [Protaetiibacter intestinalis]AYF97318.1 FAD-binding oxidoreductase [Protaetiibacter intestinalis]
MSGDWPQTSVTGSNYLKGVLARELGAVVGFDNVTDDPEARQSAAADWSWQSKFMTYRGLEQPAADFVVRPRTTAEVERVVQIANDHVIPIVPRGGGSGTQGGTLAPYGGIALDLSRMTDIVEIDAESLIVTCQAGIDGPTLEAALNEQGLTLAHYPGSYHLGASIGGFVAARGSGVVSTKYGKAENQVLQLEAVLPPGRTLTTLRVPSHAAGPDLLQTLVGSEGTLGVITQLAMRIDPLPARREFLAFSFPDIFAGMEAGRLIMTSRLRPATIRLYDEADSVKLQEWVGTPFTGTLMVIMCDGSDELVAYETRAITELAEKAGGTSQGSEVGRIWWEGKYEPYAKGKLPQPPLMYGTFDQVARFSDLPAIYRAKKEVIEREFREYGARYTAHLSHWYDWGSMLYDRFYVDAPPEDPEEAMELHDRLWDAGITAGLANGGVLNDHHGVGIKLGRFMRPQLGVGFELLRELKDAWDPNGIMNPGKLGFGPPRGPRL